MLNTTTGFWTEKKLAEYLGMSKAKLQRDRCLYGHDHRYLPWLKINGLVRYPVKEVLDWIEDQRQGKGA